MIIDNTNYWHSPVRSFVARVELYKGSALADAFTAYYGLKSISVERTGDNSKFFGYGICQKAKLKLIDKDRLLNITTEHSFKSFLSTGGDLITPFPNFFVSEAHRDENTNELSITAYDALYGATAHYSSELGLEAPYTLRDVANACASLLGLAGVNVIGVAEENNPFALIYEAGANLEGTESIREVLNAIAEASQTVYYIDSAETLTFKRLDISGAALLTISKDDYIELDSKTNRRLATIVSATELGDNISSSTTTTGSTQYIRDNPFWDLREDRDILVENAIAAVGGLTIAQFDCKWRGNGALEIGDKIALITKDNDTIYSYLLNDTFNYDGGLAEKTNWQYADNDTETASNPATLGETLKQTYARVDKANKQIEIVASESNSNSSQLSAIKTNVDSISASVSRIDTDTRTSIGSLNDSVAVLTTEVNTKMSSEDVGFSVHRSEKTPGSKYSSTK